jgi:hypothetical protein
MWPVWGTGQKYNLQVFRKRPDGKTPIAKARLKWDNNIKKNIQDVI